MKIHFICGCGLENFNKGDWISHWKYGIVVEGVTFWHKHPKLRAIKHFLLTKIQVSWE